MFFEYFNVMLINVDFPYILWESAELASYMYLVFIVPSAALSAFLRGSLSSSLCFHLFLLLLLCFPLPSALSDT